MLNEYKENKDQNGQNGRRESIELNAEELRDEDDAKADTETTRETAKMEEMEEKAVNIFIICIFFFTLS